MELRSVPRADRFRSIPMGSVDEISDLLIDTCFMLDADDLIPRLSWEWNGRFTTRMGDATWPAAVIRLSTPLWPRASVEERRETVIHELCHVLTGHKFGKMDGHGARWQSLMREAGYRRPGRCHLVSNDGLVPRVEAACRCQIHKITSHKAGQIRSGKKVWVCRSCSNPLMVLQ